MNKVGQVSILHVVLIAMTCIGLKTHVTIIPSLLQHVKRDGWASIILAMIFLIPWLFILVYIQKQTNLQPLKNWLKGKVGKFPSTLLLYFVIFNIYILTATTMRETILWISTSFLDFTPEFILLIVYIVVCFLLVSTNIQTIVIVNAIVLFFVNIFGWYVSFANLQVKEYRLLLPFFEHGFSPVLKGIVYPASGFVEIFLLLFLQHHFKKQLKWNHLLIILIILAGLSIGPLIGSIIEFGPEEASKQRYPAYEEWALVAIGQFIDHMDFLSIYQWLSGTFIRVGVLLFIAADILNLSGKPKKIWAYMVPPFFFISLILYVIDDNIFLKINEGEVLIFTFISLLSTSIIISIIAFFTKQKKQPKSNQSSITNQQNEQLQQESSDG